MSRYRHVHAWWDKRVEFFTIRGVTSQLEVMEYTVWLEQEGSFRVCVWRPKPFRFFPLEYRIKSPTLLILLVQALVISLQHEYFFTLKRFSNSESACNVACNNAHDSMFKSCVWYMLSKYTEAYSTYLESLRSLKLLDLPVNLLSIVGKYTWPQTRYSMDQESDDLKFKENKFGVELCQSPTLKKIVKSCCVGSFSRSGYQNLSK